jgi:hypothetical protein
MTFTLVATTVLSLILAAACAIVAWRVVREDRRRSEARISALASELHDERIDPILRHESTLQHESTPPMFAGTAPPGGRGGLFLAGAGVIVVLAAIAGGLVAGTTADADDTQPGETANVRDRAPLELVNLAHEQDRDQLTVHGVVRGPWIEAPYPLAAIVTLFRGDGTVIKSERAVVEPVVAPYRETSFHVTVTGALEAARFRVSFADADRVVPHVDRRSS